MRGARALSLAALLVSLTLGTATLPAGVASAAAPTGLGGFAETTWKLDGGGKHADRVRMRAPRSWTVRRVLGGTMSIFEDPGSTARMQLQVDREHNHTPREYVEATRTRLANTPDEQLVRTRTGRIGPDRHPFGIAEISVPDSAYYGVTIYAWVGQRTSTTMFLRLSAAPAERGALRRTARTAVRTLSLLRAHHHAGPARRG